MHSASAIGLVTSSSKLYAPNGSPVYRLATCLRTPDRHEDALAFGLPLSSIRHLNYLPRLGVQSGVMLTRMSSEPSPGLDRKEIDIMAHLSKFASPGLAQAQIVEQPTGSSLRRFFIRSFMAAAVAGILTAPVAVIPAANAQEQNPTGQPAAGETNQITQQNGMYIYRVKVVQRKLDCVNYLHRSGSTNIGFEGTPLLQGAKGEAKVASERGGITIEAKFEGLTPANGFGREYLSYVLWAISPDGRAQNLGEVLPEGTKTNIRVTTALQSFGLIVTAEPYFSVSEPSDVVVLQNVIRQDKTTGILEK